MTADGGSEVELEISIIKVIRLYIVKDSPK